MKEFSNNKNKSIAEQVTSMRCKYPQFESKFVSHSRLKILGVLQPTSRSEQYSFILTYSLNNTPKIKIISPELRKNSKNEEIPHLYPGENLCLYQPKYQEFQRKDFLCDTIIPWTSLWLYYYEIWLLTDEWCGGGEHPK